MVLESVGISMRITIGRTLKKTRRERILPENLPLVSDAYMKND